MTYSEVKLWNKLKLGQMMEYDFDRQRPVDNYIVDFYAKDLCLAIEINGISHDDETAVLKDETRQKALEEAGVSFLRFSALKVVHDMPNVIRAIVHWIEVHEEHLGVPVNVAKKRKNAEPTPTPPRRG